MCAAMPFAKGEAALETEEIAASAQALCCGSSATTMLFAERETPLAFKNINTEIGIYLAAIIS